ncbi:MAG: phosphoadenylyl-sulfate reductase [Pseudomonadales bacterium]|nr:phosphoadenylyl-sulfate reductase [Pseudomonadales bacterium]
MTALKHRAAQPAAAGRSEVPIVPPARALAPAFDPGLVAQWNRDLAALDAPGRVRYALEHFPGQHVLSSSFGAQAAVSLHLLVRAAPDIPVVLVDTGYLFPETYLFVDALTEALRLNLKVYRSALSPAWQEARYGQRWNQGLAGIEAYNQENKVEPMRRAMQELQAGTWFTGLRRVQAESRAATPFVQVVDGRVKVCPIADWNDRDVHGYLKAYGLPYHPLWEKGYVSIGDVHTTRSLAEVDSVEETRFFGLKRECGLHESNLGDSGL